MWPIDAFTPLPDYGFTHTAEDVFQRGTSLLMSTPNFSAQRPNYGRIHTSDASMQIVGLICMSGAFSQAGLDTYSNPLPKIKKSIAW
jgi:hypothetical protein